MPEITSRSAGEATAAFAARLKAVRVARGLSLRELGEKSGVGANTVFRIECGAGAYLEYAVRIAAALELGLEALVAPLSCGQCADVPPSGFTCNACGATSEEAPGGN